MLLANYRAAQRNDLRDLGLGPYFQDADLDDFHARALREYGRYRPCLRPLTLAFTVGHEDIALPTDWQDVHRPSFEMALDIVGSYSPIQTGYGLLYAAAEQGRARWWEWRWTSQAASCLTTPGRSSRRPRARPTPS